MYSEYLDAIDHGAPKGNKNAAKKQGDRVIPAKSEPKTRAKLAAKANVSERKAQQALNVGRKQPELAKKVAAGKMKLSDAAKQAEPKKPKRAPPVQLDLTGLPPPPAAPIVGPKNRAVIEYLKANGWLSPSMASGVFTSKRNKYLTLITSTADEDLDSEAWEDVSAYLELWTYGYRLLVKVRPTRADALDRFRKLEVVMQRAMALLEGPR